MDAGPDPDRAIEQYRRLAPGYDVMARAGMRYRRKAVELLELRRGEIVVDVACGTGLNFEPIIERVGPEGRLFGIDLSPDMLAARELAQSPVAGTTSSSSTRRWSEPPFRTQPTRRFCR
jgi:ubiquinone/menaquinone biosynthesis C-methylase UbiE